MDAKHGKRFRTIDDAQLELVTGGRSAVGTTVSFRSAPGSIALNPETPRQDYPQDPQSSWNP